MQWWYGLAAVEIGYGFVAVENEVAGTEDNLPTLRTTALVARRQARGVRKSLPTDEVPVILTSVRLVVADGLSLLSLLVGALWTSYS